MDQWIKLTSDNLEKEHICCAISDKKHQEGVALKKQWILDQLKNGHVFLKANVQGKVFIEYAPLESAWASIEGNNYIYIYCLWVAGSFKGKGYGKALLEACIKDAKENHKSGVCILSSKKKKPYISDKKFMIKYGFEVVDTVGDYELLALSFDGTKPVFSLNSREMQISNNDLTIYYDRQCPYINNCIQQVQAYCEKNHIPLNLIEVDTLEKTRSVPCVFNSWATFYKGNYVNNQPLNESALKKLLGQ